MLNSNISHKIPGHNISQLLIIVMGQAWNSRQESCQKVI